MISVALLAFADVVSSFRVSDDCFWQPKQKQKNCWPTATQQSDDDPFQTKQKKNIRVPSSLGCFSGVSLYRLQTDNKKFF
jgi:hypothetical protein